MQTYIVVLRGINVSGKNKLPMADLRAALAEIDAHDVATYIQSGNIVLRSPLSQNELAAAVRSLILTEFGYEVPTLVRTVEYWRQATANNPYAGETAKQLYVTFLAEEPADTNIEVNGAKDDEFQIVGDVVYINCLGGYGKSKLNNNLFERKLKVTATTRNWRTTLKLLELAGG